jgi:hypothetical protein
MRHLKISHLVGAAAAVSALVLLTPGVAAAQAWSVVPSPSGGQLNGVASVSANDVWAVGQTLAPQTLAEHWDGTAWSVVPTPNPAASDRLSAVAAVSTSDVWAVGRVSFSSPPVILNWNGRRWLSVKPPRQTGFLTGVTAVSANDVWAVGESQSSGAEQTLIEHFNGRKWSVVPSPNTGFSDQLTAVTSVSASDVWAVGFAEPNAFASPQTLILHWDGTSWSVVPSPDPAGVGVDNELSGATAVSATDVWAVGETGNGAQTLTEHWDGTSWTAVSSPSAGRLAGVAAVSASDIWAVGSVTDINGITTTVIEQWDGTSWSVVTSPNPSLNENVLAAASADPASGQAWAVGEFFNNTTFTRQTLTEFNP